MKKQDLSQILMAEQILLGGEVMTRQHAVNLLQSEGLPRQGIDITVFLAKALSEEDLWNIASVQLILALRLRCLALNEGRESEETLWKNNY